jgi:DNA-binding response OmpR family regulator
MEMESTQNWENNKPKVMVIEDDPELVSLLATLLKLEGYTVSAPGNHHLEGLLSSIIDEQPGITLVDVNLTLGSGLDLVRMIRAEPALKETCILMTSGLSLQRECLQSGADGFIQKPFMADELFDLIQRSYQPPKKI